jgi:hypothetical protein
MITENSRKTLNLVFLREEENIKVKLNFQTFREIKFCEFMEEEKTFLF